MIIRKLRSSVFKYVESLIDVNFPRRRNSIKTIRSRLQITRTWFRAWWLNGDSFLANDVFIGLGDDGSVRVPSEDDYWFADVLPMR